MSRSVASAPSRGGEPRGGRTREEVAPGDREAPHFAAVRCLIEEHLDPLDAKMRPQHVRDLVARIVAQEPAPRAFLELDLRHKLLSLVLHLHRAIADLVAEHDEIEDAFAALSASYFALSTEEERREFLAEHLRLTAGGIFARRGDLAALRRHLGIDAIKERFDVRRVGVVAKRAMALHVLWHVVERFEQSSPDRFARSLAATLRMAGVAEQLLQELERAPHFRMRLYAVSGLCAVLRRTQGHASVPHEWATRLGVRALDTGEHPWVQVAALRAAALVDEAYAGSLEARRLFEPSPHPHDFLVRRLLIDGLRARPADSLFATVERMVEVGDASEHVRVGLCLLLEARGDEPRRAVSLLHRLMERETAHAPRVAGLAAGLSLAKVCEDELVPEVGEAVVVLFERALSWRWSGSGWGSLCRRVEELFAWIVQAGEQPWALAARERLATGLRRIADDGPDPTAQEYACAALEALDACIDPARARLQRTLATAMAAVRPGKTAVVAVGPVALRPFEDDVDEVLGRVLARLTRRDFGIDARRVKGGLWVARGDRMRWRAWRVLHELRHRAPNKRQAFRHTVGRVFSGDLRCPAGQLDEVTPTTVPGERTLVDAEGSWGRHLPQVDDLLSLGVFSPRPVRIFSSYGVTTLRRVGDLRARLASHLRLTLRYAAVAALRRVSLQSKDAHERGEYVRALQEKYGLEVRFMRHPDPLHGGRPAPSTQLCTLFAVAQPEAPKIEVAGDPPSSVRDPENETIASPAATHAGMVAFIPWSFAKVEDFVRLHAHYFLSLDGNSQAALSVVLAGIFFVFFGAAFLRRQWVEAARSSIPLCIGGWGSRGKSGTERLKAGLLHGLGYEVFSKTTGCEAMFIHSEPMGPSTEIYVFRPYGKATIWEQLDLLRLGSRLKSEVFLWECMALNPTYVDILQHTWMRDDYATLTNCYPDHEDIQGPAGFNVAEVIARFIPRRSTLATSEMNFAPLLREACVARQTKMLLVPEEAGDILPTDILEIFPYQEHPRNIALVKLLAEELGLDPWLSVYTMAQNVVPDLGVLKTYPRVRVRGRVLRFINGCSANERAGFLNNWRRTGCDAVGLDDPEPALVMVVNNREDRISRSEVFARIMVRDVAVDAFVLIGTNLGGLQGYVRGALDEFLEEQVLVAPRDIVPKPAHDVAQARFDRLMARLRIPEATPNNVTVRLRCYARGIGVAVSDEDSAELWRRLAPHLRGDGQKTLSWAAVREELERDETLMGHLRGLLGRAPEPGWDAAHDPPEVLVAAEPADLLAHVLARLAAIVVRARLTEELTTLVGSGQVDGITPFHRRLREAYREILLSRVEVVEDSSTKGDAIIVRCARILPPGVDAALMGSQNIKGTGLDFVYRWLAVGDVKRSVDQLATDDAARRRAALEAIDGFGDHGLCDTALVLWALGRLPPPAHEKEAAVVARVRAKVTKEYEARRKSVMSAQAKSKSGPGARFFTWLEGWVEFLDGAHRFHMSRGLMRDLVHHRISHQRAAVEMRKLYDRAKGGWLRDSLRRAFSDGDRS